MGKHIHIDPFAGIAGDMFLGACIDLGAPLQEIEAALRPLPIEPTYRLIVAETFRHSIRGMDFKVVIGDGSNTNTATAHTPAHPHGPLEASASTPGTYRYIMELIKRMDVPQRTKDRAAAVTTAVGQAEARVHAIPLQEVHFHEVGAVDSIVDMLGSAVALELLDVESVGSGSLPIGRGFVRCAHGVMPLPAPATAEILKSVPHFGVEWEGETVTPTGAALVAALATSFGPMPAMQVEKVGYGAGDRDPSYAPNLLRLFLGRRV